MICLCLDTQLKTEKKASFSQPLTLATLLYCHSQLLPLANGEGGKRTPLSVMQAKLDLLQVGLLEEEAHQTEIQVLSLLPASALDGCLALSNPLFQQSPLLRRKHSSQGTSK